MDVHMEHVIKKIPVWGFFNNEHPSVHSTAEIKSAKSK